MGKAVPKADKTNTGLRAGVSLLKHSAPTNKNPKVVDKVFKQKELKALIIDHHKEYVFGQSGDFSGHFKPYAEQIKIGIETYFRKVNQRGGVHGKKLRLVSVDDYSNSQKTEENIRLLHRYHEVDRFLGVMGTRGVHAVLDLIEHKKIAMLFPWGSSPKLRNPALSHFIGGPGLIKPQIDELVRYAIQELRLKKIALYHDDSDFGKQNATYARQALARYNVSPVISASYNRHTMNLRNPIKRLKKADPKVILCLATSTPTARMISTFFEEGHYGTVFLGIDSTLFVPHMLTLKGAQFSYSSPIPDPLFSMNKFAQDYRDDLQVFFPDEQPNILSFSYYIHAALTVHHMKNATEPITNEKLLPMFESMQNLELGGLQFTFNKETRSAYEYGITILPQSPKAAKIIQQEVLDKTVERKATAEEQKRKIDVKEKPKKTSEPKPGLLAGVFGKRKDN